MDAAGIDLRDRERARVARVAYSWLNTPYHPMAKVKGHGVDCATLLSEVYAEAGIIRPVDVPYYPPDFMLHRSEELYVAKILEYAREVDRPQTADVAVWKIGRCFSHGAIIVEWPLIIHAVMGRGVLLGDAERDPELSGRAIRYFTAWASD